jgi:nicotinamide mononucleotide transporter
MTSTFFTAWDYQVTYLEFIASIASFIGVALGITGKRITWPFWAISSVLYGVLFLQWDLYASAALQLVFIAAAIAGWFGWEVTGVKPSALSWQMRFNIVIAILVLSREIAPFLSDIGAAAAHVDTLLLLGSISAQLLMVYQKFDNWVIWLIVDAGYVALYASQGLLFTALLYVLFTILAAIGWGTWYANYRRTIRSL